VLLLDADRRVVMVNAAAAEALAVLAGATVGDTLPRLGDRAIVDLFNSPPQGLWHEVSGGKQTFEVVARSVEGSLAWWVIVIRDVTQQREMEQRAQRQEQLAAVGRLAAGIAHDFNNLLQGIMSFSELLLGRPDMPEAAKKNLDLICQLGERAASITHQILDFTRQSTPEKQPLDLVPLVEEVGCILRDTTPAKIEFAVEREPGEMHIHADSTQIQQVLVNLSINARDAMPDGGTLTLRLSRFVLQPGVPPPCAELSPGEWIRLEVCDTGIGIPPQILPHIFEPFFTTKEAKGGSGLGLAQAYGIVRQHDGYIDVETEEGRGTTFTIYLPALGEIEPDARELPETAPRGQGQTVLLVDDEPTVLQATGAVLERLGYGVLAAADGRDALRVFEQHRDGIDLALIDMVMPGMTGVELSRALRARDPTFKVVVTTGYPLDERAEELRDQGIVAWVQKPVKLAQLAHALGRALGHPAEG
jgi:two-component system cell cycle sensor histidine kinase/response regulator CckA